MPAPQTDTENCVAHNGSLIPVPGRDIFVQAWYQGGISVIDFTDSSNPVEIAFFDRGPLHEEKLILGGYWSAYWFGGQIFGTEIARGLDVLALTPSDYLSQNEIDAASIKIPGVIVNAQQQKRHVWPADPSVARAYFDQLQRSNVITSAQVAAVNDALEATTAALGGNGRNGGTAATLTALASDLSQEGESRTGMTRTRYLGLASTLEGLAERLR